VLLEESLQVGEVVPIQLSERADRRQRGSDATDRRRTGTEEITPIRGLGFRW
jgi:hypothetical protein